MKKTQRKYALQSIVFFLIGLSLAGGITYCLAIDLISGTTEIILTGLIIAQIGFYLALGTIALFLYKEYKHE